MSHVKVKKMLAVIFVTVLIWIWSDLAQDERETIERTRITLVDPVDPSLWVSFVGVDGLPRKSVFINSIGLKGPATRFAEIRKRDQELVLRIIPEQEGLDEEGIYTLRLLDFLRRNSQVREYRLAVEDCEPNSLEVRVRGLQAKILQVQCFDNQNLTVQGAVTEPAHVEMYVPTEWSGQSLIASVRLTDEEIERARSTPVEKVPGVVIDGRPQTASASVLVKTPSPEDLLQPATIVKVKPAVLLNLAIQANYRVEIKDEHTLLEGIEILATDEAKRAYENQPYHVVLVIDSTESGSKTLEYFFPPEFVGKKEILLNQDPQRVSFEVIELKQAPVAGGPN